MERRIKVFVTSCEIGEGTWRSHEQKLKRLYEQSDKRHVLVDSPELADIILVGNVREENWGKKILENELINKYPDKCFSLSDRPMPLFLNHGIYANGRRSGISLGRVRTGSYTLYADEYLNPYVQSYRPSDGADIQKEYLLVFIGKKRDKIRNAIYDIKFERQDVLIEDSSDFDLWAPDVKGKSQRQKYYTDVLLRSKFSLCPRGIGTNSIRLFESMQLGVAPVIISDKWIFPRGPRWSEFSITVKERHVRDLEKIVQAHEDDYEKMGLLARKAFEEFFAEDVYFNYVVDNCVDMMENQLVPESICWGFRFLILHSLKIIKIGSRLRLRSRIRDLLSPKAILKARSIDR